MAARRTSDGVSRTAAELQQFSSNLNAASQRVFSPSSNEDRKGAVNLIDEMRRAALQVDEHIATRQEIEPRERRILAQVVATKTMRSRTSRVT